jgi:L-alanine-DL-glutamate epimerase-like enolase superfamily enzyme
MSAWERLAALPLRIDDYALEDLQRDVSSAFTRRTTVLRLRGAGAEGLGEDVTYDAEDHEALQAAGAVLPLTGDWTLGSFAEHVEGLDLWPAPPARPASVHYRIWAYESAALDLALRQAETSLAAILGRELRPVRFVVSLRLGEPPSMAPVRKRLERHPSLRFKLDPTSDWSDQLIAELVATGAVDSVDLKGLYVGSIVDQGADPDLYRRVAEAFPDAWIEDPRLEPETEEVLRPHRDRITWDANIHSVADIETLPFAPRMVNVKPSRFGPLRELLAAYEYCEARGIGMYGGGQFELGPGRGQIQLLASLFHPAGPNDTAPGGFNDPEPPPGLPASPLPAEASEVGFRWGEWAGR